MEEQDRLIDYVAICTLKGPSLKRRVSPVKNSNDASDYADMKLKVHSRFPEEDWEDAAFPRALPLFCLPSLDGLEHVISSGSVHFAGFAKVNLTSKRRAVQIGTGLK